MTTGSGDSRMFGGAPRVSDAAQTAASRTSTTESDSAAPRSGDGVGGSLSGTATKRPMTVGTAPVTRKKGRRARLTVKRIDPWSTLKFSFVYGIAGMIVLLVAAVVLYGVIDAMGVISSIKQFIGNINDTDTNSNPGIIAWLGFRRVMLVTVVVGLVNVVLFTAFATLTAFIYNVCTDIVGGVEVTLSERN